MASGNGPASAAEDGDLVDDTRRHIDWGRAGVSALEHDRTPAPDESYGQIEALRPSRLHSTTTSRSLRGTSCDTCVGLMPLRSQKRQRLLVAGRSPSRWQPLIRKHLGHQQPPAAPSPTTATLIALLDRIPLDDLETPRPRGSMKTACSSPTVSGTA